MRKHKHTRCPQTNPKSLSVLVGKHTRKYRCAHTHKHTHTHTHTHTQHTNTTHTNTHTHTHTHTHTERRGRRCLKCESPICRSQRQRQTWHAQQLTQRPKPPTLSTSEHLDSVSVLQISGNLRNGSSFYLVPAVPCPPPASRPSVRCVGRRRRRPNPQPAPEGAVSRRERVHRCIPRASLARQNRNEPGISLHRGSYCGYQYSVQVGRKSEMQKCTCVTGSAILNAEFIHLVERNFMH